MEAIVSIIPWVIVFLISLVVLIKSSKYFTDVAEKIGLYLGMAPFLIGITIVSIGTSLPELVSSIVAVLQGFPEIVIGNVLGSNITNIFLVLGIAAIIGKRMILTHEIAWVDLPLLIGSAFLLGVALWDGKFTLFEGILCILGMVIYLAYTAKSEKKSNDKEIKKEMKGELKRKKPTWQTWAILFGSALFIFIGAKYTVESVVRISGIINLGADLIAATAIALGTSLPELAVTVTAAKQGKPEIAVGNILGSNIFNAFAVTGISSLFGTLIVPHLMLTFVLPMMIVASLLFFFMNQEKRMSRWEGWILILFYAFFIVRMVSSTVSA